MQNTTTTCTPTARKSSADLQHQLYLNMKSKPQDQAADSEIWEILKANGQGRSSAQVVWSGGQGGFLELKVTSSLQGGDKEVKEASKVETRVDVAAKDL
ncbi:hypothetical protein Tco_0071400 [Tanacetum coccineum]